MKVAGPDIIISPLYSNIFKLPCLNMTLALSFTNPSFTEAAKLAHAPLPQDRVNPTPLSHFPHSPIHGFEPFAVISYHAPG